MTDLLLLSLIRAHIGASIAILAVLLLRPLVRRALGPELAYRLWILAPVTALTGLFPSLRDFLADGHGIEQVLPTASSLSGPLLGLFAAGALALLTLFVLGEWRFRRLAAQGRAGPAVMGLSWPRMVAPADYETRFTAPERALIRAHEQTHITRGDPRSNLVIAAGLVLGWFNPLVHLAARCARLDQELACDAAVVARNPQSRSLYAQTLLKAHSGKPGSVFACAIADGGRHPLEVRIGALSRRPLTVEQYVTRATLLGLLALAMAVGVWSLSPRTNYGQPGLPTAIAAPDG